ncbi:hypothetical protein UZ36_04275 [Candidatus Nitromaritima sp. SCGC AAA799-C22]|nr:hypothetical protein UZ36_04275 [Candidatus Nitromaritima sp. SCGC AAA799-C22]
MEMRQRKFGRTSMKQFLFFTRSGLFGLAFILAFTGMTQAKGKRSGNDFTINGKPVPEVVATVNGAKLTADLLKREMIAYRLMTSRQGREIQPEDEEKIAQGLLMKAIDTELIYQKGREKKIRIDAATIDREIEQIRSQFPDKKLFLAALAAQRLTMDVLKKNIEKELIKEEFIRMEIAPGVKVDDSQVKSFYKENRESLIKPATFKISHIYVTVPSPDEGKAETAEDRNRAREIIDWVRSEARRKIEEAASRLRAGRKFAGVAKEYSEDAETADKGGDLGSVTKDQTLPEIANVLVKMKAGETSGVIESPFGFHIIRLNGKEASKPIPLEEVKSDILNHLLKTKTQEMVQDYLSKLRKKSDIKIFI